ncbi:hypothetical protein T440DRAFT_471096 [Plenodomus tracheiphilus IPT5]|uniref:Uncharacterized protein n=1 Tax=Plenodomus tracheiphilus IPT5 TaxID=1408161 RepID=A0A6A7AVT4_9PLEO|nr:hypothetical protein T440DRAFT_471096 [Plenodomus tracheiphilus IPT5]
MHVNTVWPARPFSTISLLSLSHPFLTSDQQKLSRNLLCLWVNTGGSFELQSDLMSYSKSRKIASPPDQPTWVIAQLRLSKVFVVVILFVCYDLFHSLCVL